MYWHPLTQLWTSLKPLYWQFRSRANWAPDTHPLASKHLLPTGVKICQPIKLFPSIARWKIMAKAMSSTTVKQRRAWYHFQRSEWQPDSRIYFFQWRLQFQHFFNLEPYHSLRRNCAPLVNNLEVLPSPPWFSCRSPPSHSANCHKSLPIFLQQFKFIFLWQVLKQHQLRSWPIDQTQRE